MTSDIRHHCWHWGGYIKDDIYEKCCQCDKMALEMERFIIDSKCDNQEKINES